MPLKFNLLLLFVAISGITHAQISPAPDDVNYNYCPLQVQGPSYFTTSIIPNPTINPSPPGVSIISNINYVNGQNQFTLAFLDIKGEHSITINDGAAHNLGPYKFKYVNTLDGIKAKFSAPQSPTPPPNYDGVVTVPLCAATPFTYTSPQVFYQDNTGANYGTGMVVYEWQAPKGWLVNGTASTGSNVILGGPAATITPDQLSSGALQVRARNNCSATLKTSDWFKISIQRPALGILANNVNPLSLSCGNNNPVTFTVQNASLATCITGYQWNLGSPNGWLYGGSAAPTSITTTTGSITLVPNIGTTPPGNVTVTPLINGVPSTSSFTETVNFSSLLPSYIIDGAGNICTSEIYSLNNALISGSSVTWSVTPATGIVTVTPISSTSVQLTRSGRLTGSVTLTASISNPCTNTPSMVTKTDIVIGTPKSMIVGPYDATNTYLVSTVYTNNTYYFYAYEGSSGLPPTSTYTWTLTPPPGTDNFPMGFSGSPISIPFFDDPGSYNLALSKTNSCGTAVTTRTIQVISLTGFSVKASPNPVSNTLTITAEAPAIQADEKETLSKTSKAPSKNRLTIDKINMYNVSGVLVRSIANKSALNVDVDVSKLDAGTYIVEVFSGGKRSTQKILVRH